MSVDPALLHAWLAARSVARDLPAPVPDAGGFRVDTNSGTELKRWVFPHVGQGLVELARTIEAPKQFLKLCGTDVELRSALPPGWQLHAPSYFMSAADTRDEERAWPGYRIEIDRKRAVATVQIRTDDGELAASGYAAETSIAFVYDRIVTAPTHRRRGLGRAVMAALRREKQNQQTPELLVASENGRALYATLGWRLVSPYATASIAGM
jgi:GNAT superfamily N-acetyltransferase